MADASEHELVHLTRGGDLGAYGDLVRRHQNGVFSACYRILGNREEAEDVAQEAFLRGFQRLHQYDPDRPFGPWIRRVGANLALNRLAHNLAAHPPAVELDDEIDWPEQEEPDPAHAAAEQAEERQRLQQALLELPAHYRVAIELRHFQEMSYQEIAVALRIPLSDVKSHLFRARRALARSLRDGP
ncbi:MAG: sigma-70 family RNA polymerase sigma factor [Anaerolineales bacterium]|nr:sigma-70 family RNA polymerase sigma factor [Anaerolineales bacterium]